MNSPTRGHAEPTLARLCRRLDDIGMSAAERERARAHLLRTEAVVDALAVAWRHAASLFARLLPPRPAASRGA